MWDTICIVLAVAGYGAFVISLSVPSQRFPGRKR